MVKRLRTEPAYLHRVHMRGKLAGERRGRSLTRKATRLSDSKTKGQTVKRRAGTAREQTIRCPWELIRVFSQTVGQQETRPYVFDA